MNKPIYLDTSRRRDPSKLAQADRLEMLARVPLFEGAAKRHLRHLAKLTRLEQFEAERELITQGQPSRAAFVVVAGTATVRRNGRRIADVGPGDIVGELGLLLDQPRNATVRSTTPMLCLALDRAGLRSAVLEHPAFGWHLLQTVAHRLSG